VAADKARAGKRVREEKEEEQKTNSNIEALLPKEW